MKLVLLVLCVIPLTACSDEPITFNSIKDAVSPRKDEAIAPGERADYNQSGGVTQKQINDMRNYAPNQPPYAMRKLLGSPNRVDTDSETYEVRGTGNQYQAPKRFVVQYRPSADCNYECNSAVSWYEDGNK